MNIVYILMFLVLNAEGVPQGGRGLIYTEKADCFMAHEAILNEKQESERLVWVHVCDAVQTR